MYLPEVPWCKASVTSFGLKTDEKSGRESITCRTQGSDDYTLQTVTKD